MTIELDGANADWPSPRDILPALAGPDEAEKQAGPDGQAPEVNDEV